MVLNAPVTTYTLTVFKFFHLMHITLYEYRYCVVLLVAHLCSKQVHAIARKVLGDLQELRLMGECVRGWEGEGWSVRGGGSEDDE